jgi:hypothetical protein
MRTGHASGIHASVGNSNILPQNFSSVRLPTQGMTYSDSHSRWTLSDVTRLEILRNPAHYIMKDIVIGIPVVLFGIVGLDIYFDWKKQDKHS